MGQAFPALFAEGWTVYEAHAKGDTADLRLHAERITEYASAALQQLGTRPGLVHGDARADNLFFADGRFAIVDFQSTARGSGVTDIAYLIIQGVTTEARTGRDEEFVREYLARRTEQGPDDYSFDEAWRLHRAAVALLIMFPVVAMRGWDVLPARSRELCLRLVERGGAALEDVDALAVLA